MVQLASEQIDQRAAGTAIFVLNTGDEPLLVEQIRTSKTVALAASPSTFICTSGHDKGQEVNERSVAIEVGQGCNMVVSRPGTPKDAPHFHDATEGSVVTLNTTTRSYQKANGMTVYDGITRINAMQDSN
jgi:hypothetical protein